MPLSVQFRWKSPTLQAPKSRAEMDNLNQGLTQVGNAIIAAKKSRREQEQLERRNELEDEDRQRNQVQLERRNKLEDEDRQRNQEQLERRNKLEDEDRQRKQAEEDAKKKANLEVADMINKKLGERQALQAQREQIATRIETLKAQLAQLGG